MVESGRVLGEGRIRASTEKLSGRVSEKGRFSVSTGKWQNPGEYREKLESMRVSEKGRISVSSENWLNPGEYQEKVESVPLLKNCPDEFRKRVESV